jgi:hypothetical protein
MNLARQESKKKRQRKWCRYEHKHRMSAAHIDWHEKIEKSFKAKLFQDKTHYSLKIRGFH